MLTELVRTSKEGLLEKDPERGRRILFISR